MAGQKIGWRAYVDPGLDADTTAFTAAAGINNTTQISAINTLIIQLKVYGIWTKMKALYPMVGGTATSHRFNLKDPRAVAAAFYLDFNGTWTHSSTGAKPDGLTGYANTKMNLFTTLGASSISHSTYVRLNSFKGVFGGVYSPVLMNSWYDSFVFLQSMSNTSVKTWMGNTNGEGLTGTVTALGGMIMGNRYNSTTVFTLKKDASTINTSASFSVRNFPTLPYYIGALNSNGTPGTYDSNEIAFYHIGDGLTDVEAANFYNAVQTYQTTLGRQIGTAITTVSDSSAIAFIAAAGITDATQKVAINTLVTDLKSAGVWTKMKALYPFVGGSATSHKFNLKDPRDLAAAYTITFMGGMTHTSAGAVPNGSNAYAIIPLVPSTNLTNNSQHISFYSMTDRGSVVSAASPEAEIGNLSGGTGIPGTILALNSRAHNSSNANYFLTRLSGGGYGHYGLAPLTDTRGFALLSRTDLNSVNAYWNGSYYGQTAQTFIAHPQTLTMFYVHYSNSYSLKTCSFASIGDGLTNVEVTKLYTAVQKYQTTLGRQIGTPLLSAGQTAGLLDIYPNAAAAYSLRKLMNGYYGAAIRVRRSSDNAEQDIAFDANGGLDTTSLLSFVGSGNGFVTTWYDQSGNGNFLIKATANNQPRIVNAGVLETVGNKPSVRWITIGNVEHLMGMNTELTNVQSVFLNMKYLSGTGITPLLGHTTSYDYHADGSVYLSTSFAGSYVLNGTKYINGVSKTNATFTKTSSNVLISMIHTSASGKVNQISSDRAIGRWFQGNYSEIILYSSDQTTNRVAIESNINSYYSIY